MKTKRKFLQTLLGMILSTIIIFSSVSPIMAANDISVVVDNKKISFDVPPQLVGGRTMVPLRAIFEAIGATVSWDGETQTVTAYNEEYVVKATINNTVMTVNGEPKTMDIAPMLINERTLVPARFVAEAFGCNVEWNSDQKTVYIQTKEIDYTKVEQKTNTQQETNSEQTNDTILFNKYSFYPIRKIRIKNTERIQGSEANRIIASENRYNDKPNSDQEWVILTFNIDYISSTDGANDELSASDLIFTNTFYKESGSSLTVYDMATLGDKYGGLGIFDVKMYPGSSAKVVIGLLTDKNSGNIKLKVENKSEKSVTWIPCDAAQGGGSENNYAKKTESNNKYYSGTTIPTYTSVTGIPLKEKNENLYVYEYDNAETVGEYWQALADEGWGLYNKETNTEEFTTYFSKGDKLISVCVMLKYNEVWILY